MKHRLSKVLAAHGVASRRESEQIIAQGRVKVNQKIVRRVVPVDPNVDNITVDDKPLKKPNVVYYAFHKPFGVVTTMRDERGRKQVADYFSGIKERVFPVGRLDSMSSGLLLVTNDGELAQKIGHPSFTIDKTYTVEVYGIPNEDSLNRLRKGIMLREGKTSTAEIEVLFVSKKQKTTKLLVTIHEGRNRQIRRMFERIHHSVRALQRVKIGPVALNDLPAGQYRPLTTEELAALHKL